MSALIAIAVPGLLGEATLIRDAAAHGLEIRRRCVDTADLLGACLSAPGLTAIVTAALPRLSAEAVRRIRASGSRVIGIEVETGDESVLRALDVDSVIAVEEDVPTLLALLAEEVLTGRAPQGVWSLEDASVSVAVEGKVPGDEPGAKSIAVWGPAGAPGRTTTALVLAEALSLRGRTALVDADTAAPSMAVHLGLADDISGLLLACRHAESGTLTSRTLRSAMCEITGSLHALTGLSHARRRAEVRPLALTRVLGRVRTDFDYVVTEIGSSFGAGPSAELTAASVADAVIASADLIVAVCRPDPLGTARFLAQLPDLLDCGVPVTIALSAGAQRDAASALIVEAGRSQGVRLPLVDLDLDAPSLGRALMRGVRPLAARSRGRRSHSVDRLVALVA